jgi:hypothetical protein
MLIPVVGWLKPVINMLPTPAGNNEITSVVHTEHSSFIFRFPLEPARVA